MCLFVFVDLLFATHVAMYYTDMLSCNKDLQRYEVSMKFEQNVCVSCDTSVDPGPYSSVGGFRKPHLPRNVSYFNYCTINFTTLINSPSACLPPRAAY
jgi:hypothetical protein